MSAIWPGSSASTILLSTVARLSPLQKRTWQPGGQRSVPEFLSRHDLINVVFVATDSPSPIVISARTVIEGKALLVAQSHNTSILHSEDSSCSCPEKMRMILDSACFLKRPETLRLGYHDQLYPSTETDQAVSRRNHCQYLHP
uniref:Uncharacterized protein n=1 Tax=Arion vulgaris TaxID=1028688 RepID=A0A0B6YV52_9EUPU